jgi:HTH-type transcriptional regulator / antitoxin HipB
MATAFREKVAVELRRARIDVGLSQKQVAKSMGVTQSFVSKLESGTANTRLMTLVRYAEACGGRLVPTLMLRRGK